MHRVKSSFERYVVSFFVRQTFCTLHAKVNYINLILSQGYSVKGYLLSTSDISVMVGKKFHPLVCLCVSVCVCLSVLGYTSKRVCIRWSVHTHITHSFATNSHKTMHMQSGLDQSKTSSVDRQLQTCP